MSDVIQGGDNILERLHPYPSQITAAGLGEGEDFRQAFPEVSYIRIHAGGALPFGDKEFDIATANAVLEHVGSEAAQRHFIHELCRVANRVFIAVPNLFFPVEHHTGIPLAAWRDETFRVACAITKKTEWTYPAQLILMSKPYLESLLPDRDAWQTGYTGLRLKVWSSNLYASTVAPG
ncbi:MAG: methyltransferase domain-containing protein [Acidocella sp.]|nr:methyltransferase domain-containing protein [Acidocella sp.]